jgi:hypothetical protein
MPTVVKFIAKSETDQTKFADWLDMDEQICAHMGKPVDPIQWHEYWVDIIGFHIALGGDLQQIQTKTHFSPEIKKIAKFLETHYTTWYERK